MCLLENVKKYLFQTLGIKGDSARWLGQNALPFFLRDAYDFYELLIQERSYLLLVDLQKEESSPAVVRKHMEQVSKRWAGDVIYVRRQITAYNRNRLLQFRVPFMVPGNQLYLPMLAVDLRERFLAERPSVKRLSPAAQAVVFHAIYQHRPLFEGEVTLTKWAEELGYAKMSMTRAFRELRVVFEDGEIAEDACGKELWNQMRPFLKSPVRKRRYFAGDDLDVKGLLTAGESALACYTRMGDPSRRVVCAGVSQWKVVADRNDAQELKRPEEGGVDVEVWAYSPSLFAQNGVADPLSVYLSLVDEKDARIEMALDELLETVQW